MTPIELYVDQVFKDASFQHGQLCRNPVTGGYWVYGEDSISLQKRAACRALFAEACFAIYGPRNAPLLPLSDVDMADMKYTDPLSHVISCFAHSLMAHDWDFHNYPSFEEFARGCMASEYAPDFVKNDKLLLKRYPPRHLPGLGPGLGWHTQH